MLPISHLLTPTSPDAFQGQGTQERRNLPSVEAHTFPARSSSQEQQAKLPSFAELDASVESIRALPDRQTTHLFPQRRPDEETRQRHEGSPYFLRPTPQQMLDAAPPVPHGARLYLPIRLANQSVVEITERPSGGVIATAVRRSGISMGAYKQNLKHELDRQQDSSVIGLNFEPASSWFRLSTLSDIMSTAVKRQLRALNLAGLQLNRVAGKSSLRLMQELRCLNLARFRHKSSTCATEHARLLRELLQTCNNTYPTSRLQKLGLSGTHFCGANLIAEIVNVVSPQKFVHLTLLDLSGIFFNGQEVSADELSEVSAALRLPERWGPGLSVVISNEASRQIDWMNS